MFINHLYMYIDLFTWIIFLNDHIYYTQNWGNSNYPNVITTVKIGLLISNYHLWPLYDIIEVQKPLQYLLHNMNIQPS